MKKLMTIAAAALCASVFADGITSANVVGYQNKGFENAGYNIAGNSFLAMGKSADEMTLGDIKPNENFVTATIQFMTSGGANATTTFKGETVTAKYIYWNASDDPEQGEGWYLDNDGDGEINQNSVSIPMGQGFLVSRPSDEVNANLVYSGEVSTKPVTKKFVSGYNLVANCSPTDITIGDIVPNDKFLTATIQFMTSGGANATTTFKGETVTAKYIYWNASDDPEQGAGWYLDNDGDGEINQNELIKIPAGSGFLVSRPSDEADAMLTLPSAL